MSVHRDKKTWRVRWRANGQPKSKGGFKRKSDAELYDADIKRKLALGVDLHRELDRSVLTLDQFVREGFRTHVVMLAQPTRNKYAWALERHLTELAHEPLRALDVPRLAAHQLHMLDRGATPSTVREVMTRLSGILQIAVEHGHIPANPVRSLRKVPADIGEDVRPLSPVEVEQIIARLQARDRIVAVLGGHLGLRPIEIRAGLWRALDFDEGSFTVARDRTKRTAARTRTIDVPRASLHELRQWHLASGRPGPDAPIVGDMSPNASRLWNRRVLRPLTQEIAGRSDVTLYTLRHSHASALHYAGYTTPEAAERLGHDDVTHLKTYAHVIRSLRGTRYEDLDALITAARSAASVPPKCRKPQIGDLG